MTVEVITPEGIRLHALPEGGKLYVEGTERGALIVSEYESGRLVALYAPGQWSSVTNSELAGPTQADIDELRRCHEWKVDQLTQQLKEANQTASRQQQDVRLAKERMTRAQRDLDRLRSAAERVVASRLRGWRGATGVSCAALELLCLEVDRARELVVGEVIAAHTYSDGSTMRTFSGRGL